jgi:hypothetical protein
MMGVMPMEIISAESPSRNPDPSMIAGRWETRLVINGSRKSRSRDFQFLLGKLRYEPEKVIEQDLVVLNEYWDYILNRGRENNRLKKAYSVAIQLKSFMKKLFSDFREGKIDQNLFWYYPRDYISFLLSAHAYFGLKNSEYLKLTPSVKLLKTKLAKVPQPYIGVGYRDKGTMGIKCIDGTPSLEEFYSNYLGEYAHISLNYTIDDPPNLGTENRVNDLSAVFW